MKRIARNDPLKNDKFSVKAKLSEYANSVYQQEWIDAGGPDKITIGDHIFNPKNWEGVYGNKTSPGYDGIHMRGDSGKSTYTISVLQAFNLAFPGTVKKNYQSAPNNRLKTGDFVAPHNYRKNTGGGYDAPSNYRKNTGGYSAPPNYRKNTRGYTVPPNYRNSFYKNFNNTVPVWENTASPTGVKPTMERTWSEVAKNKNKKHNINPWQNNQFTLPLYNRWNLLEPLGNY